MTKYAQPCDDVTRVRMPGALNSQVKAIAQRLGVPVSTVIRDALTYYVSHPAMGATPKQEKVM